MKQKEIFLCKYGEIVLKGANRKYFEDMLCREIKKRAAAHGSFDVYRAQSTIYIEPKDDSADMDGEQVLAFKQRCNELGYPVIYVSAVTGEGLDKLVRLTSDTLETLPPITVYDAEYSPEDEAVANTVGVRETIVRRENDKYIVEGEWLYNFMGQINFDDYESLNFFQRVLSKNGVIDKLREAGIEEGDTVSIYDFEFDFVY